MGFLTSQLAARALILGLSVLSSYAVPVLLYNKPVIKWATLKVIDAASDRIDSKLDKEG